MKEKLLDEKEQQELERQKELEKSIKTDETKRPESPVASTSTPESQDTSRTGSSESNEVESSPPIESSESVSVSDTYEISKEHKEIAVEDTKMDVEPEPIEELSPFDELIRAAKMLNPRQFELPVEMSEPFPFPGSDRVEPIRNGRRVKNKRLIEVDAHGCVPIPAKLCFTCNKSCKNAPLVTCDYCSLYFHQDCLDPPMTALPAGRWMCPNHPQKFIDWQLLSSISATERMKIWDEYGNEPIDHEVIKLQFFRKVHAKNPPFRVKLKPKLKDEVEVPEIIRYQYENPPSLLPSMRDVMRIEHLRKRGTVPIDIRKSDISEADEQLEAIQSARKKLKTIFNDQEDVHGLLVEPEEESAEQEKPKEPSKRSKRSKSAPKDLDPHGDDIKMEAEDKDDVEITEPILQAEESSEVTAESIAEIKQEVHCEKPINILESTPDVKPESILKTEELQAIDEHLATLDMNTIKLLAFQRFQQIVNENPNFIQKFQEKSTAAQTVTEIARWDIHRFPIPMPNDIKVEGDETKSQMPIIRMRDRPFHVRDNDEKAHSLALSLENPITRSKIRSRAVLTFANEYLSGQVWFTVAPSLKKSVYMRYRSFSIGYGAENDLDLSRFGDCAFVSPKHAIIFYDEITKQFEMLNYSEYGTEVNGHLYTCDFTEYPKDICESPTSPLKDKRVAIQSKIKNMLDAKKKIREGIDKNCSNSDDVM